MYMYLSEISGFEDSSCYTVLWLLYIFPFWKFACVLDMMLIVFVQMQDLRSQLQEIIPEQQVVTRYIIYCTTVISYFLLLYAIMCEKLLNSCLKIISNRFSSCSPPLQRQGQAASLLLRQGQRCGTWIWGHVPCHRCQVGSPNHAGAVVCRSCPSHSWSSCLITLIGPVIINIQSAAFLSDHKLLLMQVKPVKFMTTTT
jgi:hypothetical protein